MVSARLVDHPDSPEEQQMRPIPKMMFAAGEEPVGVRVLTYQSSSVLKRIFNALEEDEVEIIRQSSFGRLIEIADKPVFSGRFARYLLSRQLKTKKKHEAWFRFSGKPVRFSLREFAIVTGLPCDNFPRKSKMKLKKTISEKPYWPTLFGKVEVVTVSSLIKMLYRKTVKDKEIRIKYACLALLESVLLPTSLNMKISREHAEAIEDLGEFFAFPWGRLSFDLLMGSIKERDEIGLSQNTIAVKGFVLGLQLVLVEAVPALTEVVDDTGSSSESDVEDLDGVGRDIFRKKHTLNPAHARSVDKRTDVIVHSILDDDPLQPLDAGNLAYSDEEQDSRVENLVEGIKGNINYNYSSFEGGMRQIDVEYMRQFCKGSSKSKKANNLQNNVERNDPSYVAATVIEKMKPRLDLLEKNQNVASSTLVEMEGRVVRQVESVLVKFKEDMINSVKDMVSGLCKDYLAAHVAPQYVSPPVRNDVSGTSNHTTPVADHNEVTIRNVLRNLSDYSTPPRSTRMSQDENRTPTMKDNNGSGYECVTLVPPNGAQSANSESRARQSSFQQRLELHKRKTHNVEEEPSFSLGLTQEEQSVGIVNVSVGEDEFADLVPPIHVADNIEERQLCRKSKRQKTVPSGLLETYQCGPHLLSRLREYRKFIFLLDDMSAMERKFEKLSSDVKRNSVVNVSGIVVSVKEILYIVEKRRIYSAKIVDILIRVIRSGFLSQILPHGSRSGEFLETKIVSAIIRNFHKFRKSTNKEEYNFPTLLTDVFPRNGDPKHHPRRYYFPFNVDNKHWVGICFDAGCGHITILDCATSLHNDASMEKYLTPLVQMLPYLARYTCQDVGEDPVIQCFDVSRPKSVPQISKTSDSRLMSLILMATHAVYGIEACKSIRSDVLTDEGKRAAILAYEFKEKL